MFVYVIKTRYLDEPANVVGEEFVMDDPLRQFVPFVLVATVDADAPFTILLHLSVSLYMQKQGERTWYLLCSRSVMTSIARVR